MPLLLSACPSFRPVWDSIKEENVDPERAGGRLTYLDAGDFVRHLVQLRLAGATDEFPAVFETIELLHTNGDPFVRNLATIGYLEGFMMQTVTNAGLDPETDFRPYLRPVSAAWWERLNQFWEGDFAALQDGKDDR